MQFVTSMRQLKNCESSTQVDPVIFCMLVRHSENRVSGGLWFPGSFKAGFAIVTESESELES